MEEIGGLYRIEHDGRVRWLQAQRMSGEKGFTVRQADTTLPDGTFQPGYVTGGGSGDYLVTDLETGLQDAIHQSTFDADAKRVGVSDLPAEIRARHFGPEGGAEAPRPLADTQPGVPLPVPPSMDP